LKTGEKLKQAGATAIAVITRFPDDLSREALDEYRHGVGVDSIAGAEAVISHLLVRHLGLPCAHAPALTSLPLDPELDPRAAGEELGHTFLTCVLVGLSRAPDLLPLNSDHSLGDFLLSDCIHADHLGAVVAPNGALGGEAVLACLERNVPLIVVSNPNLLRVTSQSLRSKGDEYFKDNLFVLHARNYVEAAGLILLLREGINVDSLYRPLSKIMKID